MFNEFIFIYVLYLQLIIGFLSHLSGNEIYEFIQNSDSLSNALKNGNLIEECQ